MCVASGEGGKSNVSCNEYINVRWTKFKTVLLLTRLYPPMSLYNKQIQNKDLKIRLKAHAVSFAQAFSLPVLCSYFALFQSRFFFHIIQTHKQPYIFFYFDTALFETIIFSPVRKCNDLEQSEINSMPNSLTEVNSA